MAINFIANDPFGSRGAPKMRTQRKRRNRLSSRAGFSFSKSGPEGAYELDTPEFLFWQCRESALAALEAWEAIAGKLTSWQGRRKRLRLLQDDGIDLNAYYDRSSFSFFHQSVGGRTFYSGASTDVVAHEIGHGLLDAIRPELWSTPYLEVGAFHESFGDCMAILTALEDYETRVSLLRITKTLKKRNFVESTIELLAAGTKALDPSHNGAKPRHAWNALKHQIPETLPMDGGPGKLINEVHSFGMVFTGCFYDLIVGLFAAQPSKTESRLLGAARKAGTLLVSGVRGAVVTPRFFQSIGRAMILADEQRYGGDSLNVIRKAFARHNVRLGASAVLGASAALSGAAPRPTSRRLSTSTRRDLASRLGVPEGSRFAVGSVELQGHRLAQVVHTHRVPLGTVHASLQGVAIDAPVPVLLGESGGRAAVMGEIPERVSTEREALAFAASLLKHGQIELTPSARDHAARAGVARPGAVDAQPSTRETHRVTKVGGQKLLVRIRFSCGCHGRGAGVQ